MYDSSQVRRPTHSETAHLLRDVIGRLTKNSEIPGSETETTASSFHELIRIVGQEIDETVLPRKLALFAGGEAVATMIASNRRLLELEISGRKIETDVDKDASPETVASAYAQALKALCARSGPLVLCRVGRAPQALTSGAVCSARHLADFSEAPYFKNRLKAFLKDIHPTTYGWIFRAGDSEAVAHDPDKELFKSLTALEQKVRSGADSRNGFRHVNRCAPLCAAFSISDRTHAMVISDGNDLLIAALPHQKMTHAMMQWSAIYGRHTSENAA